MRRRRGGGRPNAKVETTPSSFDALQIVGCKDDVVGPIIRGSYTLQEKNHDRPVFRKDEKVGSKGTTDVLLYFWDDKESPDFSGWWFGPQIGGDEVWAFHPDTTAKSPPTSGWQCPFDGPIDSSIEIVPKLVKGAQAPGRQPGTARKEVVTVVRTAAEQEALRQKELELMRQHEQISIRLQEERERLVIQRQEELERRKIMEAERKEREHHVRLLLRRALEKLRLAKPATIKELTLEVDKLMVKEGDLLGRSLRVEAEKVKHEAKLRVSKIAQFLQRADMKKREAEESKRQQEEASKKLIEQVEQYVENVEAMAESLEEKINSLEDTTEAPSDAELECWTEAVVQADKVVEEAFQTCMAFVKENTEAIAEVDYDGRPGKELLQPLIGRASTAQGKRLGASGMASIREVALQRRAVALEALERKGLAEALLEREKAIFKRYDSDGDDRMTIADALQYARSEFGFEACPSALERLFLNLADRWGKVSDPKSGGPCAVSFRVRGNATVVGS
ncbi:unnamed protein product [Durusdinium trenchii]|uniref:EF-hand domain-containing protein n=1 Tax=Durusdinium trenchii TaxID=1381693 RepID=A0ABP0HRZ2_9DINO